MKTEAEKLAQKRYMNKFTELRVRMTHEFKNKLVEDAKSENISLNEYIMNILKKTKNIHKNP